MTDKREWRPKTGWINPYLPNFGGEPACACPSETSNAYEAGADEIVRALKGKGALMTPEQMKLLAPNRKYSFGWLVFIPDKEGE